MNKIYFLTTTILLVLSCPLTNKNNTSINTSDSTPSSSDSAQLTEKRFWELMGDIGEMGKFIVAVPNQGASANIVGHFSVTYDGRENVFEKKGCSDHVHLSYTQLKKIAFSYTDVGYGLEPLMELQDTSGTTFLKLYYSGGSATKKQQQLVKNNSDIQTLFSGNW